MFPIPDSLPRHALVTGGAKRLGAAMARALAAAGFDVTIHVNASREAGEALTAELRALGRRAQVIAGDLAREGVVVNMLDQRVLSLTPHFVTYTVSKAGLWALTQQLALALAPRIRVLGIGPGPAMPSPRQSQAQFDRQCQSVPLRRGTSPEEMGRALLALLALPSVTGQVICLDGGQHLQWASSPAGTPPEE